MALSALAFPGGGVAKESPLPCSPSSTARLPLMAHLGSHARPELVRVSTGSPGLGLGASLGGQGIWGWGREAP